MPTSSYPSDLADPPGTPHAAEHRTDRQWCLVAPQLPDAGRAVDWAVRPATGAVVTFHGVVRDHAPGHTDVRAVAYEAYDAVALDRLSQVAAAAHASWPGLGGIALWHRTGLVDLGAASVNVTVSAGHRHTAFDAARFCIDVLKASAPVWKLEHTAGGPDWSRSGTTAVSVAEAARSWWAARPTARDDGHADGCCR